MIAFTLAALLLAGAATPVGSIGTAAESPAATESAATGPVLAVDVERSGSEIHYTAMVRAPEGAVRVRLGGAFGILNVSRSDGFVATNAGYRLRDGRERATLTASIDLAESRETALGAVGPNGPFQAGEHWAFAPSPRYHVRWSNGDETRTVELRDARSNSTAGSVVRAEQPVAVGDRFVFLGPHSVRTEQVDDRPVRLVVPEVASFDAGAERSFELARQVHQAGGTGPQQPVTAFVLPAAVRAGGGASDADVWLRADASERTVAHEFAHTALSLRTTPETRWLSEAAAEYLAYRAVEETGVTERLRLRVADGDAVLADRATWESEHVPYRKGAALLALLDERIQTATNGEQSLTSVLVALSRTEAVIDAATLRQTVAEVADERTAAWLEEQATGTAPAVRPGAQAGLGSLGSVSNLSALLASLGAASTLLWVLLRLGYGLWRRLGSPGSAT